MTAFEWTSLYIVMGLISLMYFEAGKKRSFAHYLVTLTLWPLVWGIYLMYLWVLFIIRLIFRKG